MVKKQTIRSSRSGPKTGQWRPFAEARKFVHTLGLKNETEWRAYLKSGKKPDDIPGKPGRAYKTEWQGKGDWLGTGYIHPKDREYRPFGRGTRIRAHPGSQDQKGMGGLL